MYSFYFSRSPQNPSKTFSILISNRPSKTSSSTTSFRTKMFCSPETIPSSKRAKTIVSVATSLTASALLFRTIANNVIPTAVHDYFSSNLQKLSTCFSSQLTLVIQEFDGLIADHMFEAANVYLGEKLSPLTSRIKADSNSRGNEEEEFASSEIRHFELSFHKKHRDMVLRSYLPYILQKAKAVGEEKKIVKLHTIDYNSTDYWSSINLDHPATFDTMAMDPDLKKFLVEDLNRFIGRKQYYKRVGKAWKRGYLLYGPPGTGKSSLVAAMANFLKFDIYDLDLREIECNSDLRQLLIGTASRSILVIEDIDCLIELDNKAISVEGDDEVTLSGLLNFIDGLWSSCGEERIIVLTTNHEDRLDPALLRPGRMDVHLHMSYCSFSGFKTLASNYLQIQEHTLFRDIKDLLEKVETTPAEVAEELMKSDKVEVALQGLIKFLQSKKDGN
uniref:AAA+ ATPase domain-containing protein n=1 Tax=Quercus lobata TaxID=97700 RepID=A0A7N2KSU8_QUELO